MERTIPISNHAVQMLIQFSILKSIIKTKYFGFVEQSFYTDLTKKRLAIIKG